MDYELREMLLDYKPLIDDLYDYKTISVYDLLEIVIICDYMIYKSNNRDNKIISIKLNLSYELAKRLYEFRNSICHYMVIHGQNIVSNMYVGAMDYKVNRMINGRLNKEIVKLYNELSYI